MRHGGGEEKHTGKNVVADSRPAKHPLWRLQMPSSCMRPNIGKVCWTSMTVECASAVLEPAEKKRQSLGLKTISCGPSAANCSEKQSISMTKAREASADAIQQIVEEAETMIDGDFELEADDIENAQNQFKINTKDTHRADKKK